MSLDFLGLQDPPAPAPVVPSAPAPKADKTDSWIATVATFAGGALGSYLWNRFPASGPKHPVLGLLNGFAVAGNIARVATREIPVRRAAENLMAHAVATAGALALGHNPVYSGIGYVAGAASANLFIRRSDSYMERLDETVLGEAGRQLRQRGRFLLGAGSASLEDVRAGRGSLRQGDSGDAVRYVQSCLSLQVDGLFGPSLTSAVQDFQRQKGFSSDGIVSATTIAALDNRLIAIGGVVAPLLADVRAGKALIKKGDTGDSVKYVQGVVGVLGDGEFGPETEAAVKAFQMKTGLGVDGAVGKDTMAALDKAAGSSGGLSVIDFTKPEALPKPATALARASKASATSPSDDKAPWLIAGRPAWQVLLAGAGGLAAVGLGVAAFTGPSSSVAVK